MFDKPLQCALTKLSYLLSKPELTCFEVRNLMGVSLRGDLTRPPVSTPVSPDSINTNTDTGLENLYGLLSRFVHLTSQPSTAPQIVLPGLLGDASAPWSWTAGEAASVEAALLPFLIHLAAARNDVASLRFCLSTETNNEMLNGSRKGSQTAASVAGGIVNSLERGSYRSPLHVAALNGSTSCVSMLLESGALVHLRDSLGHTALYYASFPLDKSSSLC